MLEVNRRAGFTLLELLVTLAIVAIIASLAAPAFQNMIATQRVRSAANDLVVTLNFARSEAVKRRATVLVTPAGATYAKGWDVELAGADIRKHEAVPSLTIPSKPGLNGQFGFLRDGRRGGNDKVTVSPPASSGATALCVSVSATGKPAVDSGVCT